MMDDTPGGFARMRILPDGSVKPVYFNDGMCKLTGMSREELMELYSKDILAGVHPNDVSVVREAFARMISDGNACSSRYRLSRGGGGYVWLTIFGRITNDASGGSFLNLYYADASEQARAEELQKELLDNLPYVAALYEFDGENLSVVHLNKRYRELISHENAGLFRPFAIKAIHPDDRGAVLRELNAAILKNRDIKFDIRILCAKDEYRPFHIDARVVHKEGGKYAVYTSITPISDDAMTYQQMLPVVLSAIMKSTTDISFAKDMEFRYICASRTFVDMLGLESENDIIGKTDYDLFERDMADIYRRADVRLLESKTPLIDIMEPLPSADGSPRYSSASKYLLRDRNENMIGLYGVARDVTIYRDAFDKLKLLTDSIPGGIATYECTGDSIKLLYFNDGYCALFGTTREEYESQAVIDPVSRVYREDLPGLMRQIDMLVENGAPVSCVYRVHTKDGGFKWISHKAEEADRGNGRVIVNVTLQDITDQRKLMERLKLSEAENDLAARHGRSIVCRYTLSDKTLGLSPEAAALFSLPEKIKNVPEEPVRTGMIAQESAKAYTEFFEAILSGGHRETVVFRQRYLKKWKWLEGNSVMVYADDGTPIQAIISFIDITELFEVKEH